MPPYPLPGSAEPGQEFDPSTGVSFWVPEAFPTDGFPRLLPRWSNSQAGFLEKAEFRRLQ